MATDTQQLPADTQRTSAPMSFTFGDPVPVIDGYDFFYHGCCRYQDWYEPPFDMNAVAKMYRGTAHHPSALQVKRNVLARAFIPHPLLSRQAFKQLATDYLILGNAYLEKAYSMTGRVMALRPSLARYTRRGGELLDRYFWLSGSGQHSEFPADAIIHLYEPDINQEVYGIPDYLGATQSILLNENGTLFRRKYYLNGAHAGFVMYVSDEAHNLDDVNKMREQLRSAKGLGNFKNLFMYAPKGKKDGVQIIPVSDVASKDEFAKIKEVTRDDTLAAHRVPPQLLGIVPNNTGGFGDVEKAARVFAVNELEPLQSVFEQINDDLGMEVIRFNPYELLPDSLK